MTSFWRGRAGAPARRARTRACAPECRQGCAEGGPGGGGRFRVPGIPRLPEGALAGANGFGSSPASNRVSSASSFSRCTSFGLGVDVPDQRLRRPQRAHQGILAAHEVQVARPQPAVERVLVDEGGDGKGEAAARERLARMGHRAAGPAVEFRLRHALRNHADDLPRRLPPTRRAAPAAPCWRSRRAKRSVRIGGRPRRSRATRAARAAGSRRKASRASGKSDFAQQATGARRESRKVEPAGQRQPRMR